ncbi:TPA: hypothetical protein DCZ15_00445 [Candidatus Falkowbacteria bacterium]|nr:hypothetical protein [Candidatus Falkowbacteria bacterium]
MSRTGKALSPDFVSRCIIKAAAKEGIVLNQKKWKIINSILSTLPTKPNPCHIAKWCNLKVKEALAPFSEYKEEADIICREVRKEILYFLNEEEFSRLANLLKEKKISKPMPQWIRNNSYALYLSIKRGFRNADNGIDWKFVFDKFDIQKFSYRRLIKYGGDKDKIIKRLSDLLEKENPPFFSPNWIERHNGSLDKQIGIVFKNDWDQVISRLDKKWHDKWRYKGAVKEVNFYKGTSEFRRLVKKHQHELYTLYACLNKEDKRKRNLVALDFIAAAQEGNLLSLNLLLDSLQLTVWAEEDYNGWRDFTVEMREKIKRSIFLFDLLKGDNFYNYLRRTLLTSCLPLQGIHAFSLNDYFDGGDEFLERTLTHLQVEEVDNVIKNIKLVMNKQ